MILWADLFKKKSFSDHTFCCIRCHFLVRISLRFLTAVICFVTKGKIRIFVLLLWKRALVFHSNFTLVGVF